MNTYLVYVDGNGAPGHIVRITAKELTLTEGKYVFHMNDDKSDSSTFFFERFVKGIVCQKGE